MIDPVVLAEAAQEALDRTRRTDGAAGSGTAGQALNRLHWIGPRASSVGTTEAARCGCGGGRAWPAIGTTSKRWYPTGRSDARCSAPG